jgi:hypothetical protein
MGSLSWRERSGPLTENWAEAGGTISKENRWGLRPSYPSRKGPLASSFFEPYITIWLYNYIVI